MLFMTMEQLQLELKTKFIQKHLDVLPPNVRNVNTFFKSILTLSNIPALIKFKV